MQVSALENKAKPLFMMKWSFLIAIVMVSGNCLKPLEKQAKTSKPGGPEKSWFLGKSWFPGIASKPLEKQANPANREGRKRHGFWPTPSGQRWPAEDPEGIPSKRCKIKGSC